MAEQGYWERLQQQRLSRRRTLAGGLSAGAGLAALAAACGGNGKSAGKSATTKDNAGATSAGAPAAASPAAKQPKRGGTVNHMNGIESLGDTMDPQTSTPLKGEGLRVTYEGLVGYDAVTFAAQPDLAQKWEQPDQTNYVFHLQPGIKWQNKVPVNGRAFVADDVVYSLNRARSNDPNFTSRSLLDSVDQITATDQSTVKLTAKAVDAALLNKLSADGLLMMAKEAVDKAGKFPTAEFVVGTGPFIMQQVADHVGADWVRNPDYWRAGQPYLDGFKTHFLGSGIPGDQEGWAAFLASQIDVAIVPGTEVKKYLGAQTAGYTPAWFGDTTLFPTTPNTKVKPFDDARVTKALRLLTDHGEYKTGWAEQFYGRARDGSFLPVSLASWDFSEQEYSQFLEWKSPKDDAVKQALDLLTAAGFTKDKPLAFQLSGTQDYIVLATLLQAQWKRLGQGAVQAEIKPYPNDIYQQIRAKRDYAYGAFTNGASFSEVDTNLTQLYYTGASRNYWNYSDPKLDAMIDKQRTIFDETQRKALIKDILRYMLDNWPGSIYTQRYFLNASKPTLRNFQPEFRLHGAMYRQVWLDT